MHISFFCKQKFWGRNEYWILSFCIRSCCHGSYIHSRQCGDACCRYAEGHSSTRKAIGGQCWDFGFGANLGQTWRIRFDHFDSACGRCGVDCSCLIQQCRHFARFLTTAHTSKACWAPLTDFLSSRLYSVEGIECLQCMSGQGAHTPARLRAERSGLPMPDGLFWR